MLVVAGLGLLAIAWAMADPPGAPPDESTNFIRALAAGRGDWLGAAPSRPPPPPPGPDAEKQAWQLKTTRLFRVPGPLSPTPFDCLPLDPKVAAGCLDGPQPPPPAAPQILSSYVGTYQPLGFVAAGLATRGSHDAATALRWARLADVGLWLGLVAVAGLVLCHPGRPGLSLLGLVVAVTPMAVFLGASVSPNGIEVAAAVGLWAALLRLARPDPHPMAWAAMAFSGVVLAFTRSLGPAFLVFPGVVFLVLVGPRVGWARFREGGRAAVAAVAAVAVAAGASLVWEAVFQPHAEMRKAVVRKWLIPSVQELPSVFREHVGVFGPLAVPMNAGAYWVWAALTAMLVVAAFVVGSRRERLALVAVLVGVPVASVVISAAVIHQTGFGMQGRYVSALAVGIPLLAGEVLVRNRARVSAVAAASLISVGVGSVATVQVLAWYSNARRYAVGTGGPRLFVGSADWSPPAGWWVWATVALAGAVVLVAFSVVAALGELGGTGRHRVAEPRIATPR